MSLDQLECGVCGYRLGHINQPCPNCLPVFYRDQFTARADPAVSAADRLDMRVRLVSREREALDMARLTLRQIAGQNVDKELWRHLAVVTLVRITEVLGEDA